ncbi:MAG: PKD domain-containing protein [Candidatus Bathyarchaeota archaeon]|nr:PKD domain-containing protein [Candidatus Bathyarchaeota archaeon]
MTYTFNWGDGTYTTTTNPNSVSHTWTTSGIYTISVTAQSPYGISDTDYLYGVTITNQPAYHYLTVTGTSAYTNMDLGVDVWIDSVYYGTTPVTVLVQDGWHDVQISSVAWNSWFGCCSYLYYQGYDDGYTNYGSGSTVVVFGHDQNAFGYYDP